MCSVADSTLQDEEMEESIPGSERPERHAATVWREVVGGGARDHMVRCQRLYGGPQ